MTIEDISTAFGARAFGAFLILFGALNLIPLPPGASFVAGVPLVIVSLQLALGRKRLWLPERIRQLKLSPEVLGKVMARLGPPLRKIERLARHRMWPADDATLASIVGWFALILTVPVLIPAPLSNVLPGVGIALLGIGLTARDGLWIAAGFAAGIVALLALAIIYGAAIVALLRLF